MKFLFKITKDEIKTLLRAVDFEIKDFDIMFYDGTKIKFADLNDIIIRNGEYVMYTNSDCALKYAQRTIKALYK